ncbi:MAG: antitoxin of toxin-antitoxin stability system [Mesorhizobium sp.]|uniref:antitoxin of toxin-antitoxin stability system n=1 Tax=Mesorhizobium sp. TaxID=1871066 RepID=UPI000FE87FC2|nr:antitoxin of toxin-antitoxin stability system [Mesorhizobium sp.]RWB36703.1 MAG: antitoxin of toxin-antitoxin stability system [Mesorhizobium sp.]
MAETEADHRPASQVVRELMRDYIERRREEREYDEFLRRKVEVAGASMRAGRGRTNDEIEADFAARRAKTASQA